MILIEYCLVAYWFLGKEISPWWAYYYKTSTSVNIFKVHGSRYLNLFGHMLHSGGTLSLWRAPKLEGHQTQALWNAITYSVYSVSQVCKASHQSIMLIWASAVLAAPGLDWSPPWLSLPRGWHGTTCEGQVRAEASLARAPTRAPFLQMDVGPFIASSLPWVLPF